MHGSLLQYLSADSGASKVLAHAELLLRLSRRYETLVPAGLGHVSRVANYKSGTVIIHADNGSAAAKLGQMRETLCQRLAKDFPECKCMEIKVQPRKIPYQSIPSKPLSLSDSAKTSLIETTRALPAASSLRNALEKLLESAGKK